MHIRGRGITEIAYFCRAFKLLMRKQFSTHFSFTGASIFVGGLSLCLVSNSGLTFNKKTCLYYCINGACNALYIPLLPNL